jgi:beta-lactamase regulating signal transducer with metallopeptidase domain
MILYIIRVALILSACFVFYQALLRYQTYFRLNRLFLILSVALCFLLPLLRIPQEMSLAKASTATSFFSPKEDKTAKTEPAATTFINRTTVVDWLERLYWFGVIVFSFNFCLQLLFLLIRARGKNIIRDGALRIVEVDDNKAPCSFGNYIFINPAKYEWETYNHILLHEKIHVKGWHSADLILAELMLIFQWFNPFAWLYRRAIKTNLEFLTDDAVINRHHADPVAYQLDLLSVSIPDHEMRISVSFNQSVLKKRIIMMDLKRSNVHTVWKYFMIIPVMVLLSCLINESRRADTLAEVITTRPIKPSPPLPQPAHAAKKETVTPVKHIKTHSAVKTDPEEVLPSFQALGISRSYVDAIRASGYQNTSNAAIIRFHSLGITAEYIQGLVGAGYANITTDDVVAIHGRGIRLTYLQGFADVGYPNIPLKMLLDISGRAISPEYASGFIKKGLQRPSLTEIMALQARGATPENY